MFFIFQVLYKHQLELDEKKKKALDKQLEFLLGQTERFSPFPFLSCFADAIYIARKTLLFAMKRC